MLYVVEVSPARTHHVLINLPDEQLPDRTIINNMIEKALLIKSFAQHTGHGTAVMLLLFLFAQILLLFLFHWCSSGGGCFVCEHGVSLVDAVPPQEHKSNLI